MAFDRLEVTSPVGIIKDKSPTDIPMNAWSEGKNVIFNNGKATKANGEYPVFGTLSGPPYWALPVFDNDILTWIYATDTGIFKYSGQSHIDISRDTDPYNFSINIGWNGGTLNGLPVANNGSDVPQIIEAADAVFKDMPNWPSDLRTKIIRPFKNYLIALNLTESASDLPYSLRWSSPADPSFAPPSWDVADPAEQAGQTALSDTAGRIVDGVPLKDQFIIYKEDSVYSMRFVGGLPVFSFRKIFSDIGALSTNCIAAFESKHLVVGVGDIYIHDGISKTSVVDGAMSDYFFSTVDDVYISRVHTVVDTINTEIWVCFPDKDSVDGSCNLAMIWNWSDNTWTVRDLPNTYYATAGVVDPDSTDPTDLWDNSIGSWDTDVSVWNEGSYNPSKQKVLLLSPDNTEIYLVDITSLFNGEPFVATLERSGIDFDKPRIIKYLNSVAPQVTGSGILEVYVGSQMVEGGGIAWKGPYPLDVGKDYKIDCRISGRFLSVKFQSTSASNWTINGYTLELDQVGED